MAKIITENFKVETTKETFSTFASVNPTIATNFLAGLETYVTDTSGVTLDAPQREAIQDIVEAQLETNMPESAYYIMGSSVDKPNSIANTQFEKREFQRRVIFGNKVAEDSIRYMFYKNDWTLNTVYDDFDDTQDMATLNGVITVSNLEGDYDVFKCIENNYGSPSLVSPSFSGIDENTYEQIIQADKYIWKYLFTVRSADNIVFGTSDSLPLPYPANGDQKVISAAKENISQIIIESTETNLFSQYVFGPGDHIDSASNMIFGSAELVDGSSTVTEIELSAYQKPSFDLYEARDSYKEMYLIRTAGNVKTLYEILSSETPDDLRVKLKINATDGNADTWRTNSYQIVPKIKVTRSTSTGTPCVAYGVIDQFGTLKSVAFMSRGSEYKYATAELALPSALVLNYTPAQAADLRCVISPKGGHGSDVINELAMSRLAVITNFSGEDVTIPNSNSYSKVGLIKNPKFSDATLPSQFDNRTTISISGDQTSTAIAGHYVQQVIALDSSNQETITARIHESVYSGVNTTIYLVDYYGDFQNTFQSGIISVKPNLTTTTSSTLTINNASTDVTYGKYSAYSGEVLHFVDFDPIQRQATRKEKIKFIFDF